MVIQVWPNSLKLALLGCLYRLTNCSHFTCAALASLPGPYSSCMEPETYL